MTDDPNLKRMVQEAARLAASQAVDDTLTKLGLDVSDPLEVQKDMAALRDMRLLLKNEEFQKDLAQIRALRTSGNFIRSTTGKAVITVAVTGLVGLLVLGVRAYLGLESSGQ